MAAMRTSLRLGLLRPRAGIRSAGTVLQLPPQLRDLRAMAPPPEGVPVTAQGWVRHRRAQKSVGFISLNDGSMLQHLQIVVTPDQARACSVGACVRVKGTLVPSTGKGQAVEIQAADVEVIGECPGEDYPMQAKEHSLEFCREMPHLRARTSFHLAVLRVRNALSMATHNFFQKHNFYLMHAALLTGNDCEGGGEAFRAITPPKAAGTSALNPTQQPSSQSAAQPPESFFDRPMYLTVSGQLHAEALATAASRVYTFGPTFRAENSNTPRHLAEFYMVEAEAAFVDLQDNMRIIEAYVKHTLEHVSSVCAEDIHFFASKHPTLKAQLEVLAKPYERMTYTEAIEILTKNEKNFKVKPKWGDDLNVEHERFLAQKHCGAPVFVSDYPETLKPFYMRRNGDGKTVAAVDLLVPEIGELVGGSAREERLDVLQERINSQGHGLAESLDWYTDLRRYGTVPHAGFGLGFERLVQSVTGIQNIRDAISFPRHPGTCKL